MYMHSNIKDITFFPHIVIEREIWILLIQVVKFKNGLCRSHRSGITFFHNFISLSQIKIRNVCLLSAYSLSTASTSLYRGLKYSLKIPYFIQDYSNVSGFLILETLCLGRSKTLSYV